MTTVRNGRPGLSVQELFLLRFLPGDAGLPRYRKEVEVYLRGRTLARVGLWSGESGAWQLGPEDTDEESCKAEVVQLLFSVFCRSACSWVLSKSRGHKRPISGKSSVAMKGRGICGDKLENSMVSSCRAKPGVVELHMG